MPSLVRLTREREHGDPGRTLRHPSLEAGTSRWYVATLCSFCGGMTNCQGSRERAGARRPIRARAAGESM